MQIEEYAKHTQFYTGEVPPLLAQLLSREDWDSLADLGCGDGALLSAMNTEGYLAGKSIYAVDLSQTRIDLVQKIDESFHCMQDDACHTGLNDGSVDLLVTTQVIEHVDDDQDLVKEIDRVLSRSGTVYLSTIFKKWYGWYFYRCNGRWTIDPTHLREYNHDDQLLTLFTEHGFEIVTNEKTLDGRALVDTVLRRLRVGRGAYNNRFLRTMRKIKLPIPGYYIWEIVCTRNS